MTEQKEYLPLLDIENILPILNRISILGGLSEKQLYSVFQWLKHARYKADEYVFQQGGAPSYIYIIRSGAVKIVAQRDDTCLELIAFGVGDCFGETSVLGIEPHSASAIAVETTELIILSREALFSIFEHDKELFAILILNIAREACRRLHKSDETLLHYFSKK